MELKINLSEQEYQSALKLCAAMGYPRDYRYLQVIAKTVLTKQKMAAMTPLGVMEAWIDVPPPGCEEEDIELGVGILPDASNGEFVDLACAKYDRKIESVKTRIFEDVMTEDPTVEFSFDAKDFRQAFPYHKEGEQS